MSDRLDQISMFDMTSLLQWLILEKKPECLISIPEAAKVAVQQWRRASISRISSLESCRPTSTTTTTTTTSTSSWNPVQNLPTSMALEDDMEQEVCPEPNTRWNFWQKRESHTQKRSWIIEDTISFLKNMKERRKAAYAAQRAGRSSFVSKPDFQSKWPWIARNRGFVG